MVQRVHGSMWRSGSQRKGGKQTLKTDPKDVKREEKGRNHKGGDRGCGRSSERTHGAAEECVSFVCGLSLRLIHRAVEG